MIVENGIIRLNDATRKIISIAKKYYHIQGSNLERINFYIIIRT